MEVIQVQKPSSSNINNLHAETEPTTPHKKKTTNDRRLTTGSVEHVPANKRVRIPPICVPAMMQLKQEMGLRSDAETILWLVRQVRPQLVPPPTPTKPTKPKPPISQKNRSSCTVVTKSVIKTACMECLLHGNPVSHLHLPAGSPPVALAGQTVRATVVQASTVFFDTLATLDKAERLIAGAAAYGSELVVFPEAFIGGYPRFMAFDAPTADDDLNKYFASAVDLPGPEVDRLANIAGRYKVHLVIGVVERVGFNLFSTVLFFNSLGKYLGHRRKLIPLPSEASIWCPGEKSTSPPVYETSIGKIGGLVCWDNKLPLLRTELYAQGIDIYCAPSADAREIWKASMIHIALEGSCFVLTANQFCRRKDYPLPPGVSPGNISIDLNAITCAGGSVIVSPSGKVLAGPNYQDECLISADLDLVEITRAKTEFGLVEKNLKPNNANWTASEPNQMLFAADMKAEVSNQLSW